MIHWPILTLPHLDQSLRILHQLAETHQIFVLTCHGRLVEKVAGLGGANPSFGGWNRANLPKANTKN